MIAGVLGVTLALTLSGMVDASAAPKRTTRQDATSQAQAAHARASQQDEAGVPAQSGNGSNGDLRGYSERPNGMCWERQGGGGQDLSGFWKKC
jgi:hypothetical protein